MSTGPADADRAPPGRLGVVAFAGDAHPAVRAEPVAGRSPASPRSRHRPRRRHRHRPRRAPRRRRPIPRPRQRRPRRHRQPRRRRSGAIASGSASPASPPSPAAGDPVLVGAGDIADCDTTDDTATAALVDGIEGTVFTAGDNAYPAGSRRRTSRTATGRPGDVQGPDAAGARQPRLGDEGPQGLPRLLRGGRRADLARAVVLVRPRERGTSSCSTRCATRRAGARRTRHRAAGLPRTSPPPTPAAPSPSGTRRASAPGASTATTRPWPRSGRPSTPPVADVVVNGHDHDYERFAPQDPDGREDRERGIREFVVGTGGAELRTLRRARTEQRAPGGREPTAC